MANVTINGVTFIPGNGYTNLSLHGQRQFNIYRFVEEDGDRLIFKGVLMPGEKSRLFAFPKTHNFVLHDSVDVGMAKYKVNCDSLDEAKKLDKRVSGKGATNVVRGLDMMGGRTGYFVEFDFAGPVESLGIGPLAIKKIKDTSDSADTEVDDAESKWTKPILEVGDAANAKYLGYFPEQNPTYPYKYTTGGRIWWIGEPPNGDYCKKYHPELYAAYLKKALVSDSETSFGMKDARKIRANSVMDNDKKYVLIYMGNVLTKVETVDGKKKAVWSKNKENAMRFESSKEAYKLLHSLDIWSGDAQAIMMNDSLVQDNVLRDETEYQFLGIHNYGGGSKAFKIKGKGLNEMENLVSLERKLGTQVEHNGFDDTVLVKFDKSNEGKIKRMLGIRDDAQAIILNDSTFVKDGVFETAMKRWGFIGSTDDNYKKGTTYIDLDNNGVYDKARLIGYFTNMTDLEQMLKHIGVIHDSTHDKEMLAELQNSVKNTYAKGLTPDPLIEQRIRELKTKLNINDIEDAKQLYLKGSMGEYEPVEVVSKEGTGAFHKVVIRHKNGKTETTIWNRLTSKHPLDYKTNEVTDGNIVGGEGSSFDGIPWGLYQEGGRSYRGFEITSSENGLRKGVYRFYNWGGGYGVPFGNSAVDGQFTEAQFQRLIGEGKVKLLDSVSVSDATNTIMVEWQKGDRWNSKGGFGSFEEAASHAKKLKSDPSYHAIAIQVNGYWFTPEGEARSGKSLKEVMRDSERKEQEWKLNDTAVNCNKFEILAKESGANFHNIGTTKKDGVTYMKFVSSAPEAEQERSVNWLRSVLEGQEGSGVLSWGMRGTSRGEMSVMIKDAGDLKAAVPRYLVTAIFKKPFNQYSTGDKIERTVEGETAAAKTRAFLSGNYRGYVNVTLRRLGDSRKMFKKGDKVIVLRGGSRGKEGEIIETGGGQYDVKIGEKVIYLGVDDLKLKDSKMFKVVDKATGKTLLVKATDSMAAVKRVSSLKDAEVSTWAYERAHNKQPRGNYGLWMFSSKPNSDDYNNKDIFFEFNGSYANAVAAAKKWAKEKGISTVHVMP